MSEAVVSAPQNPYKSTREFCIGDRLFGRDMEIDDFVSRLLTRRVVLLHSPSGAGKTSLVQAGLIPLLNRRGFHILPKIRLNQLPPANRLPPEQKPNRFLFSALMSLDAGQGIPDDQHLSIETLFRLSLEPDGLVSYLAAHIPYAEQTKSKSKAGRSATRRLLFFDQFEEVLSLDPVDLVAKKDFFARLMPVLSDSQYCVIIAIREEYVAGLDPYLIYFPDRLSGRFRLELLGQEAALQAIRKPPQGVKVNFRPDAARELVGKLSMLTTREAGQPEQAAGKYIEPMQLQVVCSDLFDRPRDDQFQITKADVEKFGPVENPLRAYYDKKIREVARGDLEFEGKLRDWIEKALIIDGSLRNTILASEATEAGIDKATSVALIQANLMREESRHGLTWYELAHDSLVALAVNSNAAWRALYASKAQVVASQFEIWSANWSKASPEDQESLRRELGRGEVVIAGLREKLLPRGEVLAEVVTWGEAHNDQLTKEQKEYLLLARIALQYLQTRLENRAVLGVNLEETGWGVIFSTSAPAVLHEALKELLDHRRSQATRNQATYYKEFIGPSGYRPGETVQQFLARNGAGSGPANPEKVPYYLLIVGDPVEIPFEFQYGLDALYAVGRIYFDEPVEYTRYAHSVVLSEREHAAGKFDLPKRMVIFATAHAGDPATKSAQNLLAEPLLLELTEQAPTWQVDGLLAAEATKAHLAQTLQGEQSPALLLTISHAAIYKKDHPDIHSRQGAIVCQDYQFGKPASPEVLFSGDDLAPQDALLGSIVFLFSSFTGGTPVKSDFVIKTRQQDSIADQPFLARLPQKLLSHPNGGALAVIAHVDQIWAYSFTEMSSSTSDIGTFIKTLSRLMQGHTVGSAMEEFNRRYTFFSSLLADELKGIVFYGAQRDDQQLYAMLGRTIDARNYIVIGDPAVRLLVHPEQEYQAPAVGWKRPSLGEVTAPSIPMELPSTEPLPLQPETLIEPVKTYGTPRGGVSTGGQPAPGTDQQVLKVDDIFKALKGAKIKK